LGDTSHIPTDIFLQIDSVVKKPSGNQSCAYKQSKFDPYEHSDDEADYQVAYFPYDYIDQHFETL